MNAASPVEGDPLLDRSQTNGGLGMLVRSRIDRVGLGLDFGRDERGIEEQLRGDVCAQGTACERDDDTNGEKPEQSEVA